jgi:rubrerythrin
METLALSLYEQLANVATDERLKKTLLDVAKEEKTHVGEFESLLKELDPEFEKELESGDKEVNSSSESNDDSSEKNEMKEAKERLYGKSAINQLNEMKIVFGKLIK